MTRAATSGLSSVAPQTRVGTPWANAICTPHLGYVSQRNYSTYFSEAVDDHQLQLGRRFAEAGLVTLVEEPDDLGDARLASLAAQQRAFLFRQPTRQRFGDGCFDGTLGKATASAIKAFQKANGMAETGTFNDELVKKVYEVAGEGEAGPAPSASGHARPTSAGMPVATTVNGKQVVKQADVLMLFYLLSADELAGLFRHLGYAWGDADWTAYGPAGTTTSACRLMR